MLDLREDIYMIFAKSEFKHKMEVTKIKEMREKVRKIVQENEMCVDMIR